MFRTWSVCERNIPIFDLGGTFDISLLTTDYRAVEVKAIS